MKKLHFHKWEEHITVQAVQYCPKGCDERGAVEGKKWKECTKCGKVKNEVYIGHEGCKYGNRFI